MGPLGWRWGRFSHAINLNAFCRLMEMNLVVAMGSYLVKTTMGRHTNDTNDTTDTRRCLGPTLLTVSR